MTRRSLRPLFFMQTSRRQMLRCTSISKMLQAQQKTSEKYAIVQATSTVLLDETRKHSNVIKGVVETGENTAHVLPEAVFA